MFKDDEIILWDTEFTSWEGCHENGWDEEEGEFREIIQIGAVKVETGNMEKLDEFNRFVKPGINPQLSEYIKELTGIDQSDVNGADKFEEVLEDFLEYSSGLALYSYFNDLDVVKRNIELRDAKFDPEERRFKDATVLFKRRGVPVDKWSSGDIAKYFEPEIELLPQHDALNDAKNMLKALQIMENQKSFRAS